MASPDVASIIYQALGQGVTCSKQMSMRWRRKGAEAGLPRAMFNLGTLLEEGEGVAAPDCPAAAGWYRRAADAGDTAAAVNLCSMYTVGRGGVC